MKINTLLESQTVSSAISNTTTSAPVFGRDEDRLEETTTSGCMGSVANPVGKVRSRGSIFSGINTSEKFPNSNPVKEENLPVTDKKQKYVQAAKDVLKGADFDHVARVRNLDVEMLRKFVGFAHEKLSKGEYKLNRPNLEEQGMAEGNETTPFGSVNNQRPQMPVAPQQDREAQEQARERQARINNFREKKQDLLQQFAQLGTLRTEMIHGLDNNVFLNKDQLIDFFKQQIEDPSLTALEYAYENDIPTDGLIKNILRRATQLGISMLDVRKMFNQAKQKFGQESVTEVGQNFRRGNARRAALNAMSPEELKAYEEKRAEQQRKRDEARLERERQRNAAKKGVEEGIDWRRDSADLMQTIANKLATEHVKLVGTPKFDNNRDKWIAKVKTGEGKTFKIVVNPEGVPMGWKRIDDLGQQGVTKGHDTAEDYREKAEWLRRNLHLSPDEAWERAYDTDPDSWEGSPWEDDYKQGQINEINPHDFDSDEDYQNAVRKSKQKYHDDDDFDMTDDDDFDPMDDESYYEKYVRTKRLEEKQRLDPKCWTGYKKQGTKMKGDTRVNNCVKVDEAEISEEMLAHELYKDLQIFKHGKDKTIGKKSKSKDISKKPEDRDIVVKEGTEMKASEILNEGKPGLWANIHAKRERIKSGSGERMRKPGSKGAPSAQDFKDAAKTEAANPAQQAAIAIAKKKKKQGVAEAATPASVSKVLRLIDRRHPEWFDNYGMGEVEDTVVDMAEMDKFHGMSAEDATALVGQELESLYGQQGMAEDYNPEYDDEAGMADNNLETLERAVQGIDELINAGDNLPEWCQEKIAVSKSMLVTVWDYMKSEEDRGALAEEFDLIESIVEGIAVRNNVDSEAIWEDLESLTDDELYVFAVTSEPINEDWQKVNKKDKTDGMSPKAVKAYRRENPGSKLKTAVTTKPSKLKKGSKASKRRKSYCSRSRGQMKMHNISCSKTPDKAICKARRRWNC